MNTLSIIKAVSLPTADHRSESWEITFSESIDQIPDEIIKKAALSVSWLWQPSIRRTSTNSVIFSGYID